MLDTLTDIHNKKLGRNDEHEKKCFHQLLDGIQLVLLSTSMRALMT
jgi:hypothetical protein